MTNGIQSLEPQDPNLKWLLDALSSGERADPEEFEFRKWLVGISEKTGMPYDPDERDEDGNYIYDYRNAWRAGEEPKLIPGDEDTDWEGIPYSLHHHWSSEFKGPSHPTIDAGKEDVGSFLDRLRNIRYPR